PATLIDVEGGEPPIKRKRPASSIIIIHIRGKYPPQDGANAHLENSSGSAEGFPANAAIIIAGFKGLLNKQRVEFLASSCHSNRLSKPRYPGFPVPSRQKIGGEPADAIEARPAQLDDVQGVLHLRIVADEGVRAVQPKGNFAPGRAESLASEIPSGAARILKRTLNEDDIIPDDFNDGCGGGGAGSRSKRVSFARTYKVKEFIKESDMLTLQSADGTASVSMAAQASAMAENRTLYDSVAMEITTMSSAAAPPQPVPQPQVPSDITAEGPDANIEDDFSAYLAAHGDDADNSQRAAAGDEAPQLADADVEDNNEVVGDGDDDFSQDDGGEATRQLRMQRCARYDDESLIISPDEPQPEQQQPEPKQKPPVQTVSNGNTGNDSVLERCRELEELFHATCTAVSPRRAPPAADSSILAQIERSLFGDSDSMSIVAAAQQGSPQASDSVPGSAGSSGSDPVEVEAAQPAAAANQKKLVDSPPVQQANATYCVDDPPTMTAGQDSGESMQLDAGHESPPSASTKIIRFTAACSAPANAATHMSLSSGRSLEPLAPHNQVATPSHLKSLSPSAQVATPSHLKSLSPSAQVATPSHLKSLSPSAQVATPSHLKSLSPSSQVATPSHLRSLSGNFVATPSFLRQQHEASGAGAADSLDASPLLPLRCGQLAAGNYSKSSGTVDELMRLASFSFFAGFEAEQAGVGAELIASLRQLCQPLPPRFKNILLNRLKLELERCQADVALSSVQQQDEQLDESALLAIYRRRLGEAASEIADKLMKQILVGVRARYLDPRTQRKQRLVNLRRRMRQCLMDKSKCLIAAALYSAQAEAMVEQSLHQPGRRQRLDSSCCTAAADSFVAESASSRIDFSFLTHCAFYTVQYAVTESPPRVTLKYLHSRLLVHCKLLQPMETDDGDGQTPNRQDEDATGANRSQVHGGNLESADELRLQTFSCSVWEGGCTGPYAQLVPLFKSTAKFVTDSLGYCCPNMPLSEFERRAYSLVKPAFLLLLEFLRLRQTQACCLAKLQCLDETAVDLSFVAMSRTGAAAALRRVSVRISLPDFNRFFSASGSDSAGLATEESHHKDFSVAVTQWAVGGLFDLVDCQALQSRLAERINQDRTFFLTGAYAACQEFFDEINV
uniref:BRCT domain-containing protein n=1 Tax=Macrostomum lignano TaxID=282301 RepID=A0A1I8IP11_9PLAT